MALSVALAYAEVCAGARIARWNTLLRREKKSCYVVVDSLNLSGGSSLAEVVP